MATVEMPAAGDSGEFWSDSLSDWESSIADAPRELAVALGNGRLAREPDALRTAIYGLFGLVAFLIALIGAVLIARELRPLVHRPGPGPSRRALRKRFINWKSPRATKTAGRRRRSWWAWARRRSSPRWTVPPPRARRCAVDLATDCPCPGGGRAGGGRRPERGPWLAQGQRPRRGRQCVGRDGARGRGAKQALVKTLGDKNDLVRWYAIEALGNMGGEAAAAVDALLPLLEHQDPISRRRAIEALGQIRPPAKQATAALTKARNHDADKTVRKAAVIALHQVDLARPVETGGDGDAIDGAGVDGEVALGRPICGACGGQGAGRDGPDGRRRGPRPGPGPADKSKRVREAAAKALGSVGSPARDVVPALRAAAHEEEPRSAPRPRRPSTSRRQVALRKISTAGQAAAK